MTLEFPRIRFAEIFLVVHVLVFSSLVSLVCGEDEQAGWTSFLEGGSFFASTGVAINYRANRHAPDPGVGWAFLNTDYETGSWYGLSAGAAFLLVPKLWQNQDGDYDDTFDQPYDLRNLYLSWNYYQDEDSFFRLSGGRKGFPGNPSLDGMSQEGLGASWSTGHKLSLHLGAFHRWIRYSTPNYDANGITGWKDVSQANEGAGDVFLAASAEWYPHPDLSVSPYINHQEGVMSVYGSTFAYELPLGGTGHNFTWNTEVILAYYQNRVSAQVEPDFNGVGAGRVYTSIAGEKNSTGVGVFWVGKGNQDTKAGLFTIFDPLKEDDLYPFNDRNRTHLFYWMATMEWEGLTIYPAVGIGRNDAVRSNSYEVDLLFDYSVSENFSLAGFFVYVKFEKEVLPDYSIVGASLAYGF